MSNIGKVLDVRFRQQMCDTSPIVRLWAIEQNDEAVLLKANAPVKVSGVPSKFQRIRCVSRPQPPHLLRAETCDDCALVVEKKNGAVDKVLAAIEAHRAVRSSVGHETETFPARLVWRNEKIFDAIPVLKGMQAIVKAGVLLVPEDTVQSKHIFHDLPRHCAWRSVRVEHLLIGRNGRFQPVFLA
jgi:hypothetical protein